MAIAVQPRTGVFESRRRVGRRVSLSGYVALAVLAAIILLAVLGPRLSPYDPIGQNTRVLLRNPTLAHPLGTDRFGRDILARLLDGGRRTLSGALTVCIGVSLIGFLMGALAASGSRLWDNLIGRLIEALMALPGIVTALAFTAVLGPSFRNLLFALTVTSWPWYARTYRAIIMRERAAPYVEGARALGASNGRILLQHVLPNVIGPSVVLATANLGAVMLGLASLSFLGLGIQPPTAEWGQMINDALPYFQRFPWQMIAPGLCIAVSVLCINLVGDALRDALDPRSSGKRR